MQCTSWRRLILNSRVAEGSDISRRDDLESVGYVLMYLHKGVLPWQGIKGGSAKEKYEKIGQKKISTSLEELCKDFPRNFCNAFYDS